ncbi:MAG: PEP-CTERM sorting domain-containing protein, partial [Planctomycetota bacterium]|nr:PEP-CTERM sorting domain-containing protein [Planctomycetota bacterium]
VALGRLTSVTADFSAQGGAGVGGSGKTSSPAAGAAGDAGGTFPGVAWGGHGGAGGAGGEGNAGAGGGGGAGGMVKFVATFMDVKSTINVAGGMGVGGAGVTGRIASATDGGPGANLTYTVGAQVVTGTGGDGGIWVANDHLNAVLTPRMTGLPDGLHATGRTGQSAAAIGIAGSASLPVLRLQDATPAGDTYNNYRVLLLGGAGDVDCSDVRLGINGAAMQPLATGWETGRQTITQFGADNVYAVVVPKTGANTADLQYNVGQTLYKATNVPIALNTPLDLINVTFDQVHVLGGQHVRKSGSLKSLEVKIREGAGLRIETGARVGADQLENLGAVVVDHGILTTTGPLSSAGSIAVIAAQVSAAGVVNTGSISIDQADFNAGMLVNIGTMNVNRSRITSPTVTNAGSISVSQTFLATVGLFNLATIDVVDNLTVQAQANPADLRDVIVQQIKLARDAAGGAWTGPGITSLAAVGKSYEGVGAFLNDRGDGTPIMPTFDGRNVDASSILVKHTWNGDANLDGLVNADDYFLADSGYITQKGGWYNGDFNYDGVVNADDYFQIDSAFIGQSGLLSGSSFITHHPSLPSSVPEPSCLFLLLGALGFSGRTRRICLANQ